ncbi:phosphopantetheine-binding protein, partial [Salmonella enterica]|uniref:phosphopantetheine-binding protein n=1 Tax=Salmonella enterica TaxID=28901 RepID=UPI0007A8C1FD
EIIDVESDFFALCGLSLLAMNLAAQLSLTFNRQVTPGLVMVASDVAQFSKLLDTDDDERSRNLVFGPLLPLRESDGPT